MKASTPWELRSFLGPNHPLRPLNEIIGSETGLRASLLQRGRGPTVNLTDQQIAARAGVGDVTAFVQLVERYRAPLIAYVFALTGRRDEAEELAQDAFCRVWEKLPTLCRKDRLVGWLYRIAHNLAV